MVYSLNLNGCTGISDVSTLGNVHNLNLSSCTEITNVNELGNVHNLDIRGLSGVYTWQNLEKI
jgi:hypothetical protein